MKTARRGAAKRSKPGKALMLVACAAFGDKDNDSDNGNASQKGNNGVVCSACRQAQILCMRHTHTHTCIHTSIYTYALACEFLNALAARKAATFYTMNRFIH